MKPEFGFSRARRSRRSTRRRPFRSPWRPLCRPFNQPSSQRGRSQSTNNLKQIGLALHNFLSANDHFPGDIRGKDSKPLLSWRVAILPFIEQQALFNEFHLDEPWDSTHNKALIAQMPATFAVPDGSPTEPGLTFYRGFSGKGTLFDPMSGDGTKIASITDGTSNTIAVVEAKEAVPWTKPESELPFDELKPGEQPKPIIDLLGGHFSDGFNALFCDGSVRFIRNTVSLQVLESTHHSQRRRSHLFRFVLSPGAKQRDGVNIGSRPFSAAIFSCCG